MFKRYFIALFAVVFMGVCVVNVPAYAGGVPSEDSNMTQQRIKEVIARYFEWYEKYEQIVAKIEVYKKWVGKVGSMVKSFKNLGCLEGASIGRTNSLKGTVLHFTGSSSSRCSGYGLGDTSVDINNLWSNLNNGGTIVNADGLKNVLSNKDGVIPLAVLDQLEVILSGNSLNDPMLTEEDKQFKLMQAKYGFSKNSTIAAVSNAYKLQTALVEYKGIASGLTKDCTEGATTVAEGVTCATQGTYVNMMLEIERTKNIASDGVARSFNGLIYQ